MCFLSARMAGDCGEGKHRYLTLECSGVSGVFGADADNVVDYHEIVL